MTLDAATLRRHLAETSTGPHQDTLRAAVASVLREGSSGWELLFIQRAERDGDPWSGHVAFPGGKREPGDASLFDTALRETREEVGLSLAPGTLAARLGDVTARMSGYEVAQFVFVLEPSVLTLATSAELATFTWRPLERLARREGAGTFPFKQGGRTLHLPCLRWDGFVLWGMTYRMTMQLLEAVGTV